MLRRVATTGLIYGALQMTQSAWGRKWLKEQGRPKLEQKLLSYLNPASSAWRNARMAEVAHTAIDAFIPLLCDPSTSRLARRGLLNIFHALEGANERRKLLEPYGLNHAPAFFVLNPTNKCSMGCPVCYMNSGIHGDSLPLWAMDKIVGEMKKTLGIHFVVVSGGEPLREWDNLVALAQLHKDITFMVYTNGTKLTPKRIRILALLGNVIPGISVEGFEAETDQRRGKGYFKKTQDLMQALKEVGVPFGFSATAMRHNADALTENDAFIDWAIAQGCRFGWFFIYVPIGRGANRDFMVTTEQRSRLAVKVFEWLGTKPILIGDFWNGGPLVLGCIAGKYYFVIEADGSIGPCVFMPLSMRDTIYDIWDGRSEYSSLTKAICSSPTFCAARKYAAQNEDCTGPCQVIDHPQEVCLVRAQPDARAHNQKTPPGFFDPKDEIQRFLRENANNWNDRDRSQEPHLKGSGYERKAAL